MKRRGGNISVPVEDLLEEHKNLVGILEGGSPDEQRREALKQEEEMKGYGKKMAVGGSVAGPDGWIEDDAETNTPLSALLGKKEEDLDTSIKDTPPSIPGAPSTGLSADDRAKLYDSLESKRRGVGSIIGQSLAGLGDALNVQSGHGNSGFLNRTLEAQKENEQRALGEFDTRRQLSAEENQRKIQASGLDPASPFSQARQKMARPILISAGYDDATISQIPGAEIENLLKNATSFANAKEMSANTAAFRNLQSAMQAQGLDIERSKMTADQKARAEDLSRRREESQADAAEQLTKMSIVGKVLHPEEVGVLKKRAGLDKPVGVDKSVYGPDVLSYAKSHGITPDAAQKIKMQRGGK
jgi:hypothetical protein